MIRVVLDTNVIVAAMRSRRGASFQLLKALGREEPSSVSYLEERARKGSREAFLEVLDGVPSRKPVKGDELPQKSAEE